MFKDVETVRQWTRVVLTIAAFPVTAFPLLYLLFSPWYKSQLGRAMLLQTVTLAFAVDFALIYQYWAFTDNMLTLLTIRFFMYLFIGVAAFYLTIVLIVLNFIRPQKASNKNVEQPAGEAGDSPPVPE